MLEFDLDRLVSLLQSYAHLPPDKLCTATFADLVAYQNRCRQTLMPIRLSLNPKPGAIALHHR